MRALAAALALQFAASFPVQCLGGCLAASLEPASGLRGEADRHACCPARDGLTAVPAGRDCCAATDGLKSAAPHVPARPVASTLAAFVPLLSARTGPGAERIDATASPPLVLRI
jgi:hypothetical protein